jgi:hypothetical protein
MDFRQTLGGALVVSMTVVSIDRGLFLMRQEPAAHAGPIGAGVG